MAQRISIYKNMHINTMHTCTLVNGLPTIGNITEKYLLALTLSLAV